MLYGQRAFKRNTGAETMSAILKEEPSELSGSASTIPAALERIVRTCMEKQPAQRFQSAQDIAFALESVTGISSTSSTAATAPARKGWARPVLAALALLIFFFQAEDGIRDDLVTGVQTCALPI